MASPDPLTGHALPVESAAEGAPPDEAAAAAAALPVPDAPAHTLEDLAPVVAQAEFRHATELLSRVSRYLRTEERILRASARLVHGMWLRTTLMVRGGSTRVSGAGARRGCGSPPPPPPPPRPRATARMKPASATPPHVCSSAAPTSATASSHCARSAAPPPVGAWGPAMATPSRRAAAAACTFTEKVGRLAAHELCERRARVKQPRHAQARGPQLRAEHVRRVRRERPRRA